MWLLVIAIVSYLIGSVPCGFLLGKMRGVDIREHGSKSIGATNALRVLGKPIGYTTFALDAFKGLAAVWLALFYTRGSGDEAIAGIVAAICCVLGHNFPIWLGFKGGKGIATSAGAMVALMPLAVLTITIVWIIVFLATGFVSLASLSAAACLPVTVFALLMIGQLQGWPLLGFAILLAVLAFWQHRANIGRLLNGTESRFRRGTAKSPRP